MSAADDVIETKSMFEFLAVRLAPRADDKAAAGVLHKELRLDKDKPLFTWNRAYELLTGRARRVDGWEKDFARQRVAALQKEGADAYARREENYRVLEERLAYLESVLAPWAEGMARGSLDSEGNGPHGQGEGAVRRSTGDRPSFRSDEHGEG